jgi:signal transduction histidine kinase
LYPVFILFLTANGVIGLYELNKGRKKVQGQAKNRLGYFILATLAMYLGAFFYFLYVYSIKIYPIGDFFSIASNSIITYAIIRYRAMDVKVAITRAGIFAFVYTLVLVIPFIVGGVIKSHISNASSNWWIIPLLIGVILASGGPFIYMRLQRRLEARLRAYEFKSHEALRRLSHNMLRFTNLNVLLKLMVHYLVKVLKLKFAAIYLFDSQSNKYLLSSFWQSGEGVELPQEYEANSYLADYLHLKKLPIVTEELSLYAQIAYTPKIKKLFSELSGLKINTAIPCFLRNTLMGFLILSDRRGNIPFTQDDLNLLMVLSNEAALAIENAQFHQKEVSQLVEKSKREALADMAPGASHQFNNRLASISSSVELLLFKMEKFNIEAHQDENTKVLLRDAKAALELIDSEVYKGKEITSAILKRAKAKVEFQEFSLVDLIENTYKLVMISRSRSGLDKARELKFNIVSSGEIPYIFASEALLQDVFYNLIDNAYDAIQDNAMLMSQSNPLFQGEIEVTLRREDHFITAQVRDNGIGLTKESHRKLFTPYFTTKATSNKGSGLGLCVIRDFVEIHKGSITCDSEYGKGATFSIKLPIKKEKAHGD